MSEAAKDAQQKLGAFFNQQGIDGVIGWTGKSFVIYLQSCGPYDKLIPKEVNGVPIEVVFTGRFRLC